VIRVINRYAGNLPMPGVFPDSPRPVIRNTCDGRVMVMMRWGMPPPPRTGGPPVTNSATRHRRTGVYSSIGEPLLVPAHSFAKYAPGGRTLMPP
jgi:putative SOS response-associated peptidase YedK